MRAGLRGESAVAISMVRHSRSFPASKEALHDGFWPESDRQERELEPSRDAPTPDRATEAGDGASPREGRRAHLSEIASQGGRAVVRKYGADYMSMLGRRGARSVVAKYGAGYYSRIGARNRGVKKRRRRGNDSSAGSGNRV